MAILRYDLHEAFVYTVDYDGEKSNEYKRIVNDPEKVIVNAKETRKRVIEKFPKAFSHLAPFK